MYLVKKCITIKKFLKIANLLPYKANFMNVTKKYLDDLTYKIIGCAIEVHKNLGPGLLESVYQKCFVYELRMNHLNYSLQKVVPIKYKESVFDAELRYDILIENLIIVELKAMEGILPIHQAQLLTYMKLLEKPKGVLVNFNCLNIFKEGQRTMVNDLYSILPNE